MSVLPDPRTKPLLKVAEVASYLPDGISDKAVRAAIDAGQIAHVRVGRYVLVPTIELYRLAGFDPDTNEAAQATTSTASTITSASQENDDHDHRTPDRAA